MMPKYMNCRKDIKNGKWIVIVYFLSSFFPLKGMMIVAYISKHMFFYYRDPPNPIE